MLAKSRHRWLCFSLVHTVPSHVSCRIKRTVVRDRPWSQTQSKASSQVLTLGRYRRSTTRMASAGLGRAGGFRETSDGSSVDDRAFASLEHRLATVLSHLIYTSNGSGGRTGNSRTLRRLKVRPHKSRDLIISRLWQPGQSHGSFQARRMWPILRGYTVPWACQNRP